MMCFNVRVDNNTCFAHPFPLDDDVSVPDTRPNPNEDEAQVDEEEENDDEEDITSESSPGEVSDESSDE